MRQGQQNRRGRGRNNNHNQNHHNRKSQNLLSKNYESSGPVGLKLRGTAQHIAEKYQHLARDASASGDFITAENYLQHAEHYNRIIMAAQAAAAQQQSYQSQNAQSPAMAESANSTNGNAHPPQGRHAPAAAVMELPVAEASAFEATEEDPGDILPDFLTQPVQMQAPEPSAPAPRPPREASSSGRGRRRRRPANGAEGRDHAEAANGAAGHVNGKDAGEASGSDADFPPDELLS